MQNLSFAVPLLISLYARMILSVPHLTRALSNDRFANGNFYTPRATRQSIVMRVRSAELSLRVNNSVRKYCLDSQQLICASARDSSHVSRRFVIQL